MYILCTRPGFRMIKRGLLMKTGACFSITSRLPFVRRLTVPGSASAGGNNVTRLGAGCLMSRANASGSGTITCSKRDGPGSTCEMYLFE